jgi:hypothetical protein
MEELIEYLELGVMYRVDNIPRRVRVYHENGYVIVTWCDKNKMYQGTSFTHEHHLSMYQGTSFTREGDGSRLYNVRWHASPLDAYLNALHTGPFFGSNPTSHFIGKTL